MEERYGLKLNTITWKQLLAVFRTFVNTTPTSNECVTNILFQILLLGMIDDTPETSALVSNETKRSATERFRDIMSKVEAQHALDNCTAEKVFDTLINLKGLAKFSQGIRDFLTRELQDKIIISSQPTPGPPSSETTSKSDLQITSEFKSATMGTRVCITFNGRAITNESNKDCKSILNRSLSNLTGVFYDEGSNLRLLSKFISKELLSPDLVGELRDGTVPKVRWGQKFWDHLSNNPSVADCLQLLCNLNDPDLRNYEMHFHRIFGEVEGVTLIIEGPAN